VCVRLPLPLSISRNVIVYLASIFASQINYIVLVQGIHLKVVYVCSSIMEADLLADLPLPLKSALLTLG
jgi:hypothetical protein